MEMKPGIRLALVLAGCLAPLSLVLAAHAQASGNQNPQSQPSKQQPKPSNPPPSSPPPSNGNPFPQDVTTVPLMPAADTPDVPVSANGEPIGGAAPVDRDPVRSPEDMAPSDNGETQGFSSSRSGLDNLAPPPDDESSGKKRKGGSIIDMPRENPKEDVNVGNYYMDQKNWKGALSRFQSALVLDPDNPDVYWGMAECQRHLGQFAQARANYLKVMEYDPDSKHAKEARKALKEPDLANAKPAGQQ